MNTQELAQLQSSSAFQQAIDTIESFPLETQEALMTIIQNRLREKRRALLLSSVAEAESAYAVGQVTRGSAADLLNENFDFLATDDIRIKGHRIGIETVLYEYLHRAQSAEEIQALYPTLSLAEVYATILYYLQNTAAVSRYLEDGLEWSHQQRQQQAANPHPASARLRQLKAEQAQQVNVVSA
jgi:uncharacterized protein (DUF433 family)